MRENVYQKALRYIEKQEIKFEGSGNNREFWSVAGEKIEVRTEESGQKFNCTCKHCSTMKVHDPFCSRIAALITVKTIFNKKEKKKLRQ